MGFKLFHRRRGRLDPTVEGKLLYEEVEKAFIGLRSIEDTALSILDDSAGLYFWKHKVPWFIARSALTFESVK